MKKLVLIDGNSLMFRAYYATSYTGNLMKTSNGLYTNALYGFVNMFNKIISVEKPDYLFVAFDKGKKTRRHQVYADYKGGRKPMPEEFAMQIPLIKQFLNILNVKQLELDEYEADDIIGSLAEQNKDKVDEVIVLTGDKDLLQLVKGNIKVSLTKKGISELETYTEENFYSLMEFHPYQLVDYKALTGDSSDNLPGITGVGPKTAIKLLNEYGTIENIINANLTGKLGENIQKDKETALKTKILATLYRDINFDFTLEDIKYQEADVIELRKFYEYVEFTSFIKKLDMSKVNNDNKLKEVKETENIKISKITEYYNNIEKFQEENFNGKTLLLEVELDGENYHKSNLLGLAIIVNNNGYFFDKNFLFDDRIKNILEKDDIKIYTIDGKKVATTLAYVGINIKQTHFDLTLGAYCVNPSYGNKKDKVLFDLFIENEIPYFEEIYGKKTIYQIPDENIYGHYAFVKLSYLPLVKDIIDKTLKETDQLSLLYELEIPLSMVIKDMELVGFKVDKNRLETIGDFLQSQIKNLEQTIYKEAGEEFNIASPKQLGIVLFDHLGIGKGKKNKTGYSTSADVLEKLAEEHIVPRLVLEYRKYAKLYSTYVIGLINEINPKDNKVHTTFKQSLTLTGRLSSTEPNIQNIPIRTEDGKLIRSAFIPSTADGLILSADYSQIELRILAHLSNCQTMIDDINNGIDFHTSTACKIYGIGVDQVTKDERRVAKAVNFGIVYGISDWGLSEQLHINPKEAAVFINKYFEIYPEIKEYLDQVIIKAKELGYTSTIFKRRRYMPDINSSNVALRKFTERTAMNAPIQGSAADIIKLAMINLDKEMKKHQLHSKMVAQVHDELIIDVVDGELEIMKKIMKETMENVVNLSVKLDVDTEVGKTWDLK